MRQTPGESSQGRYLPAKVVVNGFRDYAGPAPRQPAGFSCYTARPLSGEHDAVASAFRVTKVTAWFLLVDRSCAPFW